MHTVYLHNIRWTEVGGRMAMGAMIPRVVITARLFAERDVEVIVKVERHSVSVELATADEGLLDPGRIAISPEVLLAARLFGKLL